MTDTAIHTDGRHDFDFFAGRWHIANRRRVDVFDPDADWYEFPAEGDCRLLPGVLGNHDTFDAVLPDGRAFHGMTLRLFDPDRRLWRIWWASATRPAQLDPPVEGRFTGDTGVFECDDEVGGRPVRVRFQWTAGETSAQWRQAFRWAGGPGWVENWVMDFTRQ